MLRTLAAAVAMVVAIGTAHAEKRVALVIGNDAYDSVPKLEKAVNDARTMAETLTRLGFEVIAAENLARRGMNRKVQEFANRIEPGDVAMVFYAGHGVEIDGENFLLPTDIPDGSPGQEGFIKQESVGLNDVLGMLRDRRARLNLVILDACRNNPFSQRGSRGIGGTRGLARVQPPRGTFIMYSAGAGEQALDWLGDNDPHPNSVFTRTLVPLMQQPGRSLVSAAREVRREVRKVAASTQHSQTPAYYDEVLGDFYFVPSSPTSPPGPSAQPAVTGGDSVAADYRLAAAIGTRSAWELFLARHGDKEKNFYVGLARAALEGDAGQPSASDNGDKVASLPQGTAANAVTRCDELAAHPHDERKADVEGVRFDILQKHVGEAVSACRQARAKDPDNLRFAFQLGRALDADGRYDEMLSLYRLAAEAGYTKAMSNLGIAYAEGKGVSRDEQEAVRLYRKAAELGDVTGMLNLGSSYGSGKGVETNPTEAIRWIRKAAELGEENAMYHLAGGYDRGQGLPTSKPEAMRWYRKAAERGHPQAMTNLGYMYQTGVNGPADMTEAVRWYRKAAELGEPYGMNNLGIMYANGQGVATDHNEAVRWYRRAAEAGHVLAMNSLGIAYYNGTGVQRDYGEAVRWYRKAADKDDVSAMYNIGLAYREGNGVAKDQAEAVRWFRKAADKDNAEAMFFVALGHQNGEGVARDLGEARRWHRKSADAGSPGAMSNLGVIYARGLGVKIDYKQAVSWYRKAAEKGYIFAMYNLGGLLDRGFGAPANPREAVQLVIKALKSGEATIVQDFDKSFKNFSQTFRVGVQRALKNAGVYQGKLDGKYGPQTRDAVRRLAGR